jgi:hypothetical protein
VCYDALSEDIRSSGSAVAAADISARCRHSHHALLLLGHLESWVSLLDDEPLQQALAQFYQHIRTELLRLQAAVETSGYTNLAMRICEARAAWQCRQAKESSRFAAQSGETHFSCSI